MGKISFFEDDKSLSVASADGLSCGLVVVTGKGRAEEAVKVSEDSDFIAKYGKPDPKKSVTPYSALCYLQKSSMYVARAIHIAPEGTLETEANRTARFSASLVRGEGMVEPLPNSTPGLDFQPERVVEPYITADGYGLRQSDVDSFSFPLYPRKRAYQKLDNKVVVDTDDQPLLVLDKLDGIKVGAKLSFGLLPNDASPFYIVEESKTAVVEIPKLKLDGNATANKGDSIRRVIITPEKYPNITTDGLNNKGSTQVNVSAITGVQPNHTISFDSHPDDLYVVQSVQGNEITLTEALKENIPASTEIQWHKRTYTTYSSNPLVLRKAQGSDEVFISSVDLIGDGDLITFLPTGITSASAEFRVTAKSIYKEKQNQIVLDKPFTSTTTTAIHLMVKSETEMKDCLLVYADSQGFWGNDITIKITKSIDYPETCRVIEVFADGAPTGEKFEVSFKDFVDGLGKQRYVEDMINGKSNYIRVKHNPELTDDNGEPLLPALNNMAVWRELPEDIFEDSGVTLTESLTKGETDLRVTDYTAISIGDRIKLGGFTEEYKVTNKSTQVVGAQTEYHLTIDRPVQVDAVTNGAPIKKYARTEPKKLTVLDKIYFTYKPNDYLLIGKTAGKLLDSGANLFSGGHDGSLPDIGDMIRCAKKAFSNRETIAINQILSGGVFSPQYAQALKDIAETRGDAFAYLSNDPSNLDATDPVKATVEFRQNLNINSSFAGLTADWVKIYDPYNKKDVVVACDGVEGALQSLAANGGIWGIPSAGWQNGKLFGVTDVYYAWTEDQREDLLNSQINPCKKDKSRGISIWGNKTLYASRSHLQSKNVRFILMQLRVEVREYMEDQHWNIQDGSTRAVMVETLKERLQSYSKVLNNWDVVDRTTPADEDLGNLKIYVGITPKGVVENIDITFGIFSNTKEIVVS